ncbi:YbaN family protein [Roseovarius sp. 2305UL8-3]|uniref:YbaN family protein n=1 Tax=Roseovarius conchicola TaxID=3121636 RepID=UPI0035280E17
MRTVWLFLGMTCLGLGVIGVFLPLLPTVPFMLLAAFCFARSSERLHNWLLSHPRFGPSIVDWQERRAIHPKAKRLATLSIALVFGISLIAAFPLKIIIIQGVTLGAVLIFIWTRPNY